jgi:tetratricopeptide (TPR) repeat protein
MAAPLNKKDRNVIPNFRSFGKTVLIGELESESLTPHRHAEFNLDSLLRDWEERRTIGVAGDLLGAALVADQRDKQQVKEAAEFVTNHDLNVSPVLLRHARNVLDIELETDTSSSLQRITEFLDASTIPNIRKQIRETKKSRQQLPRNPFPYVELARLYSILGLKEQAIKYISIAASLAPANRYIIRSLTRVYSHFSETQSALQFLKRRANLRDPWILSAEIALTTLQRRVSPNVTQALRLLDSSGLSEASKAELASSLATVELHEGSLSKSRKLFRRSLIAPNDNALAQAEWASKQVSLFGIDLGSFDVKMDYEATALGAYKREDWDLCLQNAEKWFIDMPFVKRPIQLGADVAFYYKNLPDVAAKFVKAGLIPNPEDPMLLNNLAYYLAEAGEVSEASATLARAKLHKDTDDSTRICINATEGLIAYKQGDPQRGREQYLLALSGAADLKNEYLGNLAFLNFAAQEIQSGSADADKLLKQVNKMKINDADKELEVMRNRVVAAHSQAIILREGARS